MEYTEDKGERLAASLAFYAAFSLAPLLVLGIAIAGIFLGQEAARQEVSQRLQLIFSPEIADYINEMVQAASASDVHGWAAALSVVTLLYGSAKLFMALRDAIDIMWGNRYIQKKKEEEETSMKQTILEVVKQWLVSFSLVPAFGAMLMLLIIISTVLSALNGVIAEVLKVPEFVPQLLNLCLSMASMTLTFAVLFRVLPSMDLKWKHVIGGAAATAAFFVVAKSLLSIYFAYSSTGSVFGAAGTLAALMMWLYFSAQIVLFGAEFTQVWVATVYDKEEFEELDVLADEEQEDGEDKVGEELSVQESDVSSTALSVEIKRQGLDRHHQVSQGS